MIDQASVPSLMGSTVRDSAGEKIGKVGQVYLDDTTGQPEWVTVRTGLFGTKESFVPLAAARVEGDELVIDIPKSKVHEAPRIDEEGHLSEEQETELYTYYGVSQGPFGRQAPTETDSGLRGHRGGGGRGRGGGRPDRNTTRRPGRGPGDGGPRVRRDRHDRRGVRPRLRPRRGRVGDRRRRRPERRSRLRPRPGRVGHRRPVRGRAGLRPRQRRGERAGDDAAAAAGVEGGTDQSAAARGRLRRWMVTDERSTTPVVDETGQVVGEVSAERVDVRPLDEDGDETR